MRRSKEKILQGFEISKNLGGPLLTKWRRGQSPKILMGDVAEKLEVHRSTVMRWEHRTMIPGTHDVHRIYLLTGIPHSAWSEEE